MTFPDVHSALAVTKRTLDPRHLDRCVTLLVTAGHSPADALYTVMTGLAASHLVTAGASFGDPRLPEADLPAVLDAQPVVSLLGDGRGCAVVLHGDPDGDGREMCPRPPEEVVEFLDYHGARPRNGLVSPQSTRALVCHHHAGALQSAPGYIRTEPLPDVARAA